LDHKPNAVESKVQGVMPIKHGFRMPNKGVCHNVVLPFILKSILMQKKNYGNSNIHHHSKNISFKKNPLKETKSLQGIITLYNN